MHIERTTRPAREIADVRVWHCPGCAAVHMAIGKMVVNFTRKEFSAFTDAVVDINFSWPVSERTVFDIHEHDADVYLAASIN